MKSTYYIQTNTLKYSLTKVLQSLTSHPNKMTRNLITNTLSYTILIAIACLFFPIPKIIIASVLFTAYFLFLLYTATVQPSAAFYFLIFITLPIASFIIPSPIPSSLSPLLQLAIAVAMWGIILSLIISIAILVSNHTERHSSQPSTSPQDHVLQKHS